MIITISGKPGSGKSTLGKMLSQKLGYKHYYIGGIRRKMARDHGMTLAELNAVGEKEDWTDREVDDYQKELATKEDDFVIEGRNSFLFMPQSIKVFIDVGPEQGAGRVFKDVQKKDNERNEASGLDSVHDVMKSHQERIASDKRRYRKYYNIDVYDPSHYDFVLDTTNLTIEESYEALLKYVLKRLEKTV